MQTCLFPPFPVLVQYQPHAPADLPAPGLAHAPEPFGTQFPWEPTKLSLLCLHPGPLLALSRPCPPSHVPCCLSSQAAFPLPPLHQTLEFSTHTHCHCHMLTKAAIDSHGLIPWETPQKLGGVLKWFEQRPTSQVILKPTASA